MPSKPWLLAASFVSAASYSAIASAAICTQTSFSAMPPTPLPVMGDVVAASTADLDSDGYDDLIVALTTSQGSGVLLVLRATGSGQFASWIVQPLNAEPRGVAVGRLDGDALPDIAVATTHGISTWFAIAASASPRAGDVLAPNEEATAVAIAYWDGDDFPDVVGAFASKRVRAYAGSNSNGSLSDSRLVVESPNNPDPYADKDFGFVVRHIVTGDVFGARKTSIVVTGDAPQPAGQTTTIRYGATQVGLVPGAGRPLLRDLNRDGNTDLIVTYPDDTSFWWWHGRYEPQAALRFPSVPFGNNGQSHVVDLASLLPYGGRPSAHSIALADVNGDSDVDAIVSDQRNGSIYVLPGSPHTYRGFTAGTRIASGYTPFAILSGRYDSDGSADLAVLATDNRLHVYRNACTQPAVNLRISGLEVVQQIQSVTNDVPLIPGRRTFVRAYVDATLSEPVVSANLYGADSAGIPYQRVLKPLNRDQSAMALGMRDRRALDGALFFELPPEWTSGGDLQLRLEINPDRALVESNYSDNVLTDVVQFADVPPIKIELVRYVFPTANGDVAPTDAALTAIESRIRRELPAGRFVFTHATHRTATRFRWADDPPGHVDLSAATEVYQDYERATAGTLRSNVIYVVVTGSEQMGGIASSFNGSLAVSGPGERIAVHEIGHLMGRRHVSCTSSTSDETGPDTNYPYAGGRIGSPRFAGLDVGDASLHAPTRVVWSEGTHVVGDHMSYCDQTWFSDYNHEAIADRFRTRFPMQDPFGDFLSVVGRIDAHDRVRFSVQRRDQASYIPVRKEGSYAIRLLDESGKVLANYPFEPSPGQEEESFATFNFIVDFVAGTRSVVIVGREGDVRASIPVSRYEPQMEALWREGEASSGPITIEWRARDEDGDTLTADVLFSPDKGENWRVVTSGWRESFISFDSSALFSTYGEKSGILRVRVTDGVHIAYHDFVELGLFGSAPTLRINAPFANAYFGQGQTLVLAATAGDRDDGTPPGSAITWISDRDGVLGTGEALAPYLSEGVHTITAEVVDRDGLRASASTIIHMGPRAPAPSRPIPIAHAPKEAFIGVPLVLDGSASKVEGMDGLELRWEVIASPVPGLAKPRVEQLKRGVASFTPPVAGVYVARLIAAAGMALATEDVTIVVEK